MSQQDHYLMYRIGQIHTLVKQIHTQVCANPPKAQVSKSFIGKDMLIEFGRNLPRVIIPIAWPYILALLTWIGAMMLLGYKLVLRYFGGGVPGV